MRILITNDDGVFAPGIAALARGLSVALGAEHEFFVVAPLTDHSGASSAVGPRLRTRGDPLRDGADPRAGPRPDLRDRRDAGARRDPGLHRRLRPAARPGRVGHQSRAQHRSVGPALGYGRRHPHGGPVRRARPRREHRLGRRAGAVGIARGPRRRLRALHRRAGLGLGLQPQRPCPPRRPAAGPGPRPPRVGSA